MQIIDEILGYIQEIILSFLVRLGPFFVALMPALFTGYSIYHTFESEAGHNMALFFAVVVGFAIEAVGIVATHTAIDLYNAAQENLIAPVKFRLMAWLVPVYVVGVAMVVLFSKDAFSPLVKGLGVASPFLTAIVYIAVALARDLSKAEARRRQTTEESLKKDAAEVAWKREKERLEIELRHREKLARIEAKAVSSLGVKTMSNSSNFDVKDANLTEINAKKGRQKKDLLDSLVDIYLDDPRIGVTEAAHRLGVSRQTIYNYQDELEQAGIIHRNGQGIEVLQ